VRFILAVWLCGKFACYFVIIKSCPGNLLLENLYTNDSTLLDIGSGIIRNEISRELFNLYNAEEKVISFGLNILEMCYLNIYIYIYDLSLSCID